MKVDMGRIKSWGTGLFFTLMRMGPGAWKDLGLGRLMVVEVITGGGGLRAMILKRAGVTIEVEAMVQAPPGQGEALDHGLSTLIPLLSGAKPPRDVLLLTDEARFIPLEIEPRRKKKKARDRKDAAPNIEELRQALYQEVEPYLDVPLKGAMIAYQQTGRLEELGFESKAVPFLVSVMSLAVYRRWKKVLEKRKMRLQAIMPLEVAFYSAVAGDLEKDECLLVAEIRNEVLGIGAILGQGGGLVGYQSLPVEKGRSPVSDLAGAFQALALQVNAAGMDVSLAVVSGAGVESPEACSAIGEAMGGMDVKAWRPGPEVRVKAMGDIAAFAPLLSAGLAGLSRRPPLIPLITDHVSLMERIKGRVHFLPLLLAGLVLTGFSGHYAYMRLSMNHYERGIENLTVEKNQLKSRIDRSKKARMAAKRFSAQTADMRRQMVWLQQTLPARARAKIRLLKAFRQVIPNDVELDSLVRNGLGAYELRGRSLRAASVTRFGSRLRGLEGVKTVNIPAIEEVAAIRAMPAGQGEARRVVYRFVIKLDMEMK